MKGAATLLADRGAEAAETEFFRSREFMAAEDVTHSLVVETKKGVLRAPLKVNQIGGGGIDAISPYGYPGLGGEAQLRIDPAEIDFTDTGLVSIFMRHRLDEVPLEGSRGRNLVFIADPKLPRKVLASDRRRAEKNDEAGYTTEILEGPASPATDRAAFAEAYTESMVRLEAKPHYFDFDAEYFGQALECRQSRLAVTRDGDGEVAAATLVALSDGYIHYYLTGISEAHVERSPTKNLVRELVEWSIETGTPLCLGGGKESDEDSLTEFKRGFANRTQRWQTSEIVCDPKAYRELSTGREDSDYFPAYRATAITPPVQHGVTNGSTAHADPGSRN